MNRSTMFLCALVFLLTGCASGSGKVAGTSSPKNVLVVMNANSPDSAAVANYYAQNAGSRQSSSARYGARAQEEIPDADFEKTIRGPIKDYLENSGLKDRIDYIVLTRGIPIRTSCKVGHRQRSYVHVQRV